MNSSNQDVILFYLKFSLIFWAALGLVVACGIFCCKGRLLSGCGMWTPDWACLVVACGAWAWLPHSRCFSSKNNIVYKEVHELLLFYFLYVVWTLESIPIILPCLLLA